MGDELRQRKPVPPQFWAKSDAGGHPHSLVAHLLDSGATAELLWSRFLSRKVRRELDTAAQGRGRDLLVLLATWHDLGKATPAFQDKQPSLCTELGIRIGLRLGFDKWPHGAASAAIAHDVFAHAGVQDYEWLLPLLAGHHGRFYLNPLNGRTLPRAHGDASWQEQQRQLAKVVAERVGVGLADWQLAPPPRGTQLALAGLIVMADWIASSDLFPGVGLVDLPMAEARHRAERAWRDLGLRPGWEAATLISNSQGFRKRFAREPRPLQTLAMDAASASPAPGLMIIEAPMGEGKTEAAAAVAEILGASTGSSGVTFAMPTQGTTDAMYDRVCSWVTAIDPTLPVSLLHGKAMLNESWRRNLSASRMADLDGHVDEYSVPNPFTTQDSAYALSFTLGRHRGLLAHHVVATVDQVLWAATRTRFVSLRHAGLANHILIIDEVHSYDVHMGIFLDELLRWCARSAVPVILMSATLPPALRQQLVKAWLQGANLPEPDLPPSTGYPTIFTAAPEGTVRVVQTAPHRPDISVSTQVFNGDPDDSNSIATALATEVQEGGCALAIFNTVRRAQSTYSHLRDVGVPTLLLHGRLTAAERARRTQQALDLLGPNGRRPQRLVVVATQIAEQSFDVDADVLYSDVAPMDLLLQRVGRLHRHPENTAARPTRHTVPRLIITGLSLEEGFPRWPKAFAENPTAPPRFGTDLPRTVYRPLPLLNSARFVMHEPTWLIPRDVPDLVAQAYEPGWHGPESWLPLCHLAAEHEQAEAALRRARAATYRLDSDPSTDATNLWGLHTLSSTETDDGRTPVIRDGDESLEVCLIKRDCKGLLTLGGRPLGPRGERAQDNDVARTILGDSVRLRWRADLSEVGPLPDWTGHPLLGFAPVIVLDAAGRGFAGRRPVRYDPDLGLVES